LANHILVTGATGTIGIEVARQIQAQGVPLVVGVRNPAKVTGTFGTGLPSVRFDFTDSTTFDSALSNVDRLFLMRPPAIANIKHDMAPFIAAAARAKLSQVVFLSLQGADHNTMVPHHAIEQCILQQKLPYTFLRPSFFMQNLSTTHVAEIRDRDEIFIPAGKGKTSFIDARDIAAVATKTLTESGHIDKGYELTSNDALSYYEIATILSEVLGRTITYRSPCALHFLLRKLREGTPIGMGVVMTALYTVARLGKAGGLTKDTETLLGRPPIAFRQFAEDNRALWARP